MKQRWYFTPFATHRGWTNMAIDFYLSDTYQKHDNCFYLRGYNWLKPTISLGHSQNIDDIDLQKCEADGVDVVRRPTGGRAIYHENELTYAVIFPRDLVSKEGIYHQINKHFAEVLGDLHVESTLEPDQPDFATHYRSDQSSPCFSLSARYELKVKGKKILGSAQRMMAYAGLQHGSFLIGQSHVKLIDYLKIAPEQKDRMRDLLAQNAIELTSLVPDASILTAEKLYNMLLQRLQQRADLQPLANWTSVLVDSNYLSEKFELNPVINQ
jgi:lipoate-protein ligase A